MRPSAAPSHHRKRAVPKRPHLLIILSLAFSSALATRPPQADAASPPPNVLDCTTMPCAVVAPGASRFEAVEGKPYWLALGADGQTVGWVVMSTDLVDVRAYSGKPLVTLVGLDSAGIVTGARVVHHSEPILLVGIPEKELHDFADFYEGKNAIDRIVVGRARKGHALSVDAISGATVTALAQNQTILGAARALGVAVGVVDVTAIRRGHFVQAPQPSSFEQLVAGGALQRLRVTERQMGTSASDAAFVDLFFGIADAPHIGRALMGDNHYRHHMALLEPGQHLFVVFGSGSNSFKGSAFVRGGLFDRIRIEQGLREISFRDTDYRNLPDCHAEGAPDFKEGAIFITRGGIVDPGAPYDLVFLGSRYDRRTAFSREFHEFKVTHQIPESVYVVDEPAEDPLWVQAWYNRTTDALLLGLYLLAVMSVFAFRRWSTATVERITRLQLAAMVGSFLLVGVYMGAQPSVTQIFTLVDSVAGEWRWELFASEPLIFMLWVFIAVVTIVWGRGVFCGWVCPYGVMTELVHKLAATLHLPQRELPSAWHTPLRYVRYGVLVVLTGVYLVDSILAERLAEIEPFKSTFLVPAWERQLPYLTWWLVLLAASAVTWRPFCRYLCPLGAGLALFGSFRLSGPRRRLYCDSCKICPRGCEPEAIRDDGSIDPRECLSCMTCEANYRSEDVCPPLVSIGLLEKNAERTAAEDQKLQKMRLRVVDR